MTEVIREPKIVFTPDEQSKSGVSNSLLTWIKSRSQFLELDGSTVKNNKNGEVFNAQEYQQELIDMDLAFNYFDTGTFDMTTSVLIRDFFYTFQEYKGKWATTQRYSTQKEMVLSSECSEIPAIHEAFDEFERVTKEYNEHPEDTNFDQVREKMPLGYQVNWQMHISIKQFCKMMAVIYCQFGESSLLWRELVGCMLNDDILKHYVPKILKYTKSDEVTKYTIKGFKNHYPKAKEITDVYEHLGKVGCVFYSQLVRHEDTYTIGYIDFMHEVLELGDVDLLPNCARDFDCYLHQSEDRKLEMLRVRTEWFAVTDDWESNNTWSVLLRKYFPKGTQLEDVKKYFACFDHEGNYHPELINKTSIDDSLRLHKGYNTYFPNAFHLEYRKLVEDRIARYGDNPLLQVYLQFFDKGYVKDNPNNPDRIKWINLNKE